MTKIPLGTLTILILTFIIVAMCCAFVIAGRFDKHENNGDNNEGDKDIFLKKQICPKCRTGKESYELDRGSEMCPYVGFLNEGKCPFYKPLESFPKRRKEK